jgi:hypothetical protein
MTSEEGHRLGAQTGSEAVAKGDLPLRVGQDRLGAGQERRQLRFQCGAPGAGCGAVTAVAQPVAIAGLAAALSNRADFATPSLLGRHLDLAYAARVLHSGRITRADSVLISARPGNTAIPWAALMKINFTARG